MPEPEPRPEPNPEPDAVTPTPPGGTDAASIDVSALTFPLAIPLGPPPTVTASVGSVPEPSVERQFRGLEETVSRLAIHAAEQTQRLQGHGDLLAKLALQVDWLTRVAAQQMELLRRECDGLRDRLNQAERELDAEHHRHEELNRKHQEALRQLALRDPRKFTGAGGAPSHDALAQAFQRYKTQEFERLAQAAYAEAGRQRAPGLNPDRRRALAEIKGALTRRLLVVAAEMLAAETPPDLEVRLTSDLLDALQRTFGVRLPADAAVQAAVREAVKLLRDLAAAQPPGGLVLADGEPFNPERHEAIRGCPEGGNVRVEFTVFPGYRITGGEAVSLKAEVATVEAG